jgi:hypothetical protein
MNILFLILTIDFTLKLILELIQCITYKLYPKWWLRLMVPFGWLIFSVNEPRLPLWMPHIAAHEKCHETLGHNQKEKRIRFLRVLCRPLYNWLCWQMELEADECAAGLCGTEKAGEALAQLAHETPPTAPLFALFYSAHPPPHSTRCKGLNTSAP